MFFVEGECVYVCVIILDHKCLGFIGIYQFGFNEITHLQVGAASSPARLGLLRLSALITISYTPPPPLLLPPPHLMKNQKGFVWFIKSA